MSKLYDELLDECEARLFTIMSEAFEKAKADPDVTSLGLDTRPRSLRNLMLEAVREVSLWNERKQRRKRLEHKTKPRLTLVK